MSIANTTPSAEKARGRYAEIRVPVGSSNISSVTFVVCRDCGALVYWKAAHDEHHDRVIPPGEPR